MQAYVPMLTNESTPTKALICRKFRKELSIFFNNANEITFVFY